MTIINMAGGKAQKPIVVEAVEDTPSTLPYTFSPREGVDYLSSVTVGKDPNLVPGNVKKDVSIFGTVGTLESGGGGGDGEFLSVSNLTLPYLDIPGETKSTDASVSWIHSISSTIGVGVFTDIMTGCWTTASNMLTGYSGDMDDITAGEYGISQDMYQAKGTILAQLRNLRIASGVEQDGDIQCEALICGSRSGFGGYIPLTYSNMVSATIHVSSSPTVTLPDVTGVKFYYSSSGSFPTVGYILCPYRMKVIA